MEENTDSPAPLGWRYLINWVKLPRLLTHEWDEVGEAASAVAMDQPANKETRVVDEIRQECAHEAKGVEEVVPV